jgi:hypothetical protein
MDIKELLKISPDELRRNVQVCLEHSCAIFLGDYRGLSPKEEDYIKEFMNLDGEPDDSDLEYKAALHMFLTKMKETQTLWHKIGPVNKVKMRPLHSLLLGIVEAFELSEISIPPMEALITGQWKNFVLSAVRLMSPSGMKMEVLGEIIMYLIDDENLLEWCKREIICDDRCESFNLYTNQTVQPLEKLLGEAPETGGLA